MGISICFIIKFKSWQK